MYLLAFLKNLNNFVGFITPVLVKWLIHMKNLVTAPALLVRHVSIIACTTVQIEVSRKSLGGKLQRYNCIYTAIYMYLGLYL